MAESRSLVSRQYIAPEQKVIGLQNEWNFAFFWDVTLCVLVET
jgi:hypothetical protein